MMESLWDVDRDISTAITASLHQAMRLIDHVLHKRHAIDQPHRVNKVSERGERHMARVKKAVRMRTFPASSREIQKSKLHTQKISLEFHEHKVY